MWATYALAHGITGFREILMKEQGLRFDLATNSGFNDNLNLSGYLAYGFKDQTYKGKAEVKYLLGRTPWSYIDAYYKKDIDNGQVFYDQFGSDNIFGFFFRKPGISYKVSAGNRKKNRILC